MNEEENVRDIDEVMKSHDFIHNLFVKSATLTAQSNQFPNSDEISFYKRMPVSSERIRGLTSGLIKRMERINAFAGGGKWDRVGQTLKFSSVVETLDIFFENIDKVLDKIKNINNEADRFGLEVKDPGTFQVKETIEKPQIAFQLDVDNSDLPFVPRLKSKPFASKPLDNGIVEAHRNKEAFFADKMLEEYELPHPYQFEIEELAFRTDIFEDGWKPEKFKTLMTNQHKFVDTLEGLRSLVNELSLQKEIAVDLEHHSLRSFHGITCLLQISTRSRDYIIDPFPIWGELHLLNEVFANPAIVKVFHGADSDVIWLQRDFGVYIVNLFDTGQAARILGKESFSLSYLLLTYCRIVANKSYQLADWRIRPLPHDMQKYAVEDTHYLLYIYDELRAELAQRSLGENVSRDHHLNLCFLNSKKVALRTFKKQPLKNEQYYDLIRRNKPILSAKKYAIFKKLLKLRHEIGKSEDENPKYMISNKSLFSIIDRLPKTEDELLKLFKAGKHLIKKYSKEILDIVNTEEELAQPEPQEKPVEKASVEDFREKLRAVNAKQEEAMIRFDFEEEANFPTSQFSQLVLAPKPYSNSVNEIYTDPQEQRNKSKASVLSKIKSSFTYGSSFEYLGEVYPELKDSFQVFAMQEKIREAENNKKRQQANEEGVALAEKKEGIDFIELPEIKEKTGPKAVKKDIRLPMDPISVMEKYGLNPNYKNSKNRKRDLPNAEHERINKKLKTENSSAQGSDLNKFSILVEEPGKSDPSLQILSSGEEKPDAEEIEEENFKQLAKKINEKIKSRDRHEIHDPLANIDAIFEKRRFQKNKKNFQKTKFGDKYSRRKF